MIWLLVPLVLLLGAAGRRIAGGGLNQWAGLPGGVNGRVMGDTPARLIYAALTALAGVLGGLPWILAAPLILAIWIGSTTGNFNSIGMGRGGNTFLHDWWGMTAHGAVCAALALVAVVWMPVGHWYLAGVGFLSAPVWYALGWALCGLRGHPKFPAGLQTGSDLAEALWGAASAFGLFAAYA